MKSLLCIRRYWPAARHDQLHFHFVGHDDAEDLPAGSFSQADQETERTVRHQQIWVSVKASWARRDSQRTGGQVGVLVLQFSIQGEASLLPVVGQEGSEGEDLAEGRAGRNDVTEETEIFLLVFKSCFRLEFLDFQIFIFFLNKTFSTSLTPNVFFIREK